MHSSSLKAFTFFIMFTIAGSLEVFAQTYFVHEGYSAEWGKLHKHIFNPSSCSIASCEMTYLGYGHSEYEWGMTMTPLGDLIIFGEFGLSEVDTITGAVSWFFGVPPQPIWPWCNGLVTIDGIKFYTISVESPAYQEVDTLYEFNISTGVISNLGKTSYSSSHGDLTLFNGEIYYTTLVNDNPWQLGIVRLDLNNPSNSELLTTLPEGHLLYGLSATKYCNTLISFRDAAVSDELVLVNLIDGAIIVNCDPLNSDKFLGLTSMEEFSSPTICDVSLDLDCDDSSGATQADFNSSEFTCHSDPAPISDLDIFMTYDARIVEMRVQLVQPLPNDPFEILYSTGTVPNITVSGSGTDFITLINDGEARSTDFMDALRLIRYDNNALLPIAGLRTVEVQFTTESGSMSNVANAFIQVNELPLVEVDLGPDLELCQGEFATFDAGNPGAIYEWSTGETSQTITVDESGEYIVTVSDDINCPNQDTVELTLLLVVHVSLDGPFQTCDNVPLALTINTDSPFTLTVEISATPGSPFIFNDVIGAYTFNDLPTEVTQYTISSVTPSQPACIEITDPTQLVDVYPSYIQSFDASICDGDSIWLGFYWETEAGVYENAFTTFDGCDSIVTTNLSVLPAINISLQGTTCDSSVAGIFFEYLNNPNGCDTVIQTTITLLPSDTTYLTSSSCNLSSSGIFTQTFSNQDGCDSLVITTVNYTPPADTTLVNTTTCDSSQTGIFQQLLLDQTGCDSMVITTVSIGPGDTTYLFGSSCDTSMIGVTQNLYNNQQGCDSLVITSISAGQPDTTYFNSTSCDSASLGVFEEHFISIQGCDSTVITTIAYSASDSTFIQYASCDPDDVGVFVDSFVNRFGCDSIVTTEVSYAISHYINLSASTCNPSDTGTFTQTLTNQYGCDSIVTTMVELLPSDVTFLFSTTCMSSEAGMFITTHLNQYGCDSTVTLTISLVPADTTIFSFNTCDPAQVGNIENTFTNIDGCDSLVIEQTTLHPLPELQLSVTSDYNGYAISCFGESDDSAIAEVNGVPPLTYLWSTGADDQTITGLSAGSYAVTVTDGNGCTTSDEVTLFEPEEFSISFMVSQPDCFDHQDGSITVEQSGGIEPIRYSMDEINYQSSHIFDHLPGGTYTVTAIDANDCEVKEIIWINVPLMVHVELPGDQMAFPGDTVIIQANVNVPYDSLASVVWSGLNNPACPNCLSQPVAPIITTTYSVTVTSFDGCSDEDAMTLFLERDDDVYVPNIFSPNGDGVNDVVLINAGSDVEEILEFVVFDRWGNVVYADDHFEANDVSHAWDGTLKEKKLNPGVFAYKVIVQFTDGRQDVRYGDITIVR